MRSSLKFVVRPLALSLLLSTPARAQDESYDDYSAGETDSTMEETSDDGADEPSELDEEGEGRASKERKAPRKLHLALRTGYGVPLGEISDGVPLASDTSRPVPIGMSGMIPIHLDIGYMAFPKILLGLYAQYGVGFYTDCRNCTAADIRFGIQIQYHFILEGKFDPWLGYGLGYELMRAREHEAEGGNTSSFSAHGFELANLQAGLDIKLGEALLFGPFVSFSLGQFGDSKTRLPGGADESTSISDPALHMWLEPGIKATLRL